VKPGRIHGGTRVLGAPEGWDPAKSGECAALEIRDRDEVMDSAWYPTAEEKAAIMAGQPVVLTIWGRSHPPVSVNVAERWPQWCPVHLCWEDAEEWMRCDDELYAQHQRENPPTMTVAERVEATLFGDCKHREGDFEAVAADVLKIPQEEVDRLLAAEVTVDGRTFVSEAARLEHNAKADATLRGRS
jgi:hypothetical protein